MARARPVDIVLVAILTPLWLLCVLMHGRLVWDGKLAWVPVHVVSDAYPAVTDLWPDTTPEAVGVARGDLLLAVGDADLAGVGRIGFLEHVYAAADAARTVPLRIERNGAPRDVTLRLRPVPFPWRTIPLVTALGVMGLLLAVRGSRARAARAWALSGLAYSLHWSLLLGDAAWQVPVGLTLLIGGAALFPPLLVRACLLTPDAAAPPSRAAALAPWLLAVNGPATSSWLVGVPFSAELGLRIVFAVNLLCAAGALAALTRNYRRSDPIGRRQIKWVLLGIYAGAAPIVFSSAVAAFNPGLWWVYELSLVATVVPPFCIFIAFVRFNFLDIDRLLSATAAMSLLSVLALSLLLSVVPLLSDLIGSQAGIEPGSVQSVLFVGVAAVLVPAERYVRPPIERLLFRERDSLETGVRALRGELARAEGPEALFELLGGRLAEFLRLDRCVIYGRAGGAYAPLFAQGTAVPPAFDANGPLVALLEERPEPVLSASWRRWARRGLIRDADRAALESLGPAVLLPIRREQELEAFVCLGEKRSGDVFTRTDLALLEGVADNASAGLERFDRALVESTERSMHDALRSYVPGAVADVLAEGGTDLETGEREVTVLFVDIRGYTGFSEGRRPQEIFDVVNTYTTAVSEVVRDHGGAVVEFHGDGLMAVFGAPRALAAKEQSAVEGAAAIVDRVAELRLGDGARLEVGVGIATGEAFVGDIQAVDRRIWGVIGNTTNLAARLQGLTRELDASVVLDETTHDRAGAAAKDYRLAENIQVRGRSDTFRTYSRPRQT